MANVLTRVRAIFRYVVSIEQTEFDIAITSDGMICWTDQAKCSLMGQIRDGCATSRISLPVSKEILVKASEMARKEHQEHRKIGFKSPSTSLQMDIAEMDLLLREFFWNKVEPLVHQNPGLAS